MEGNQIIYLNPLEKEIHSLNYWKKKNNNNNININKKYHHGFLDTVDIPSRILSISNT